MNMKTLMKGVTEFICRRPWVVAAVAILLQLVRLVERAILFGNQCPSQLRFMPELSDETIVRLADLHALSLTATSAVTFLLLTVPILPLVYRKYRTVLLMLLFAVPCVVVRPIEWLYAQTEWHVGEEVRIAQGNIRRKEEAKRRGWPIAGRSPIVRLEQRSWDFADGRFAIWKSSSSTNETFLLSDEKWKKRKGYSEWENRVLLEKIVRWSDCGDVLYVITDDGGKFILDYQSGRLSPCPKEGVK